ncbi:MAG: ATP-binding protein, partial [Solirubrobacterales bacterium]
SYLHIPNVIEAARKTGADALHPGYGFLSEDPYVAEICADNDITFLGPRPDVMEKVGDKAIARDLMKKAGLPLLPGTVEPVTSSEEALEIVDGIGYPVIIKAVAGGGGRGMNVVHRREDLVRLYQTTRATAQAVFKDSAVYIERYLEAPRHTEVQLVCDQHGNGVYFFERDCSVQRRHQKLIEEAPGPKVDAEMRERIGKIATDAAAAVGYRSAGTVEGLQVGDDYFFLEMNTRVQVEHCVTEMVTGIDIVREQIRIAAGGELSISQEDVELRGHAIECRINAEAAHKNFAPAPGKITSYREPSGPGVRVDSGVEAGSEVTPMYDPMVAKLIVWDNDRERATARMRRALAEYEVGGLTTLIPFHSALMATEQWAKGETCRDLVGDRKWLKELAAAETAETAVPPGEEGEKVRREYFVEVGGKLFDVQVIGDAPAAAGAGAAPAAGAKKPQRRERKSGGGAAASGDSLVSPLQGNVFKVPVEQGQAVTEGDLVCVIEAMKMENEITAHKSGKITQLAAEEGAAVNSGDLLAKIE